MAHASIVADTDHPSSLWSKTRSREVEFPNLLARLAYWTNINMSFTNGLVFAYTAIMLSTLLQHIATPHVSGLARLHLKSTGSHRSKQSRLKFVLPRLIPLTPAATLATGLRIINLGNHPGGDLSGQCTAKVYFSLTDSTSLTGS